MRSEFRSILAIGLSVVFLVIWMKYINPTRQQTASAPTVATQPAADSAVKTAPVDAGAAQSKTAGESTPTAPALVADPQAGLAVKTHTLKNNLVEVDLTSDGAAATAWRTFDYSETADKKSPPKNIVTTAEGFSPPLSILFENANFSFPAKPKFELTLADETKAVFVWRSQEAEITKTISLDKDSYLADVNVEMKNRTDKELTGRAALLWSGAVMPKERGGFLNLLKGPEDREALVFYLNGKVTRETSSPGAKKEQTGSVLWAGLESRYFIGAVIPRVHSDELSVLYGEKNLDSLKKGALGLWNGAALPSFTIPPGDSAKSAFSVYAGPKDIDKLKAVGVKMEEAIDYGWFTIVAIPILYLLKFFYGLIHNYGIAIILLTIFVKLLLHPINVKSLKSMKAMQTLQPRLKEIQKKYAGDKQKINAETMQLFKSHKVNPMGGCLPMLLQFPIYIALYKVLWNSIELYHAPFFWFYKDLSAPDPYFITPILLGIFMVAQQKLTPQTSADPAQQKMMMLMPVMFSLFMLFLPSGLVVYILVNTVMSVTQQYMYNHGIGFMDIAKRKWKKQSIV